MNEETRQRLLHYIETELGDVFSVKQVKEGGYSYETLRKLIDDYLVEKQSHGVYTLSDSDVALDDLYMLQQKYKTGIASNDTALFLHGYSERVPLKYTMTFLRGYNPPSLNDANIDVKRVKEENYDLGVTTIMSPYGNPIKAYDLERTLCDILRGSGSDLQIVNQAYRDYLASDDKDVIKLMNYAEKLHVAPKVRRYLEILS